MEESQQEKLYQSHDIKDEFDLELYSSGLNLRQVFKLDQKVNTLIVDTKHFHS